MPLTVFANLETFGAVRAKVNANALEVESRLAALEAHNSIDERACYVMPAPVTISEIGGDPWQEVSEFDVALAGGSYDVHTMIIFGGTATNRDMSYRYLVDGVEYAAPISKELKDSDDEIVNTRISEVTLPAATYNVRLQCLIPSGGGTPDMTVLEFKTLFRRFSL